MDGDPAQPEGRLLGHLRQPAARHRWSPSCWRAGSFPGKLLLDGARPPAAGHAAGGHRLPAAAHLRPARADRRAPRPSISASSSRSAGPARRSPAPSWRFPLLVRAIRLSIEAVDRRLEEAAGTLGASPLWVFATVTLPLTLPGVIAGMILAFAKAMGEFGATITFVSNIPGETQTLPLGDLHLHPGPRRRGRRAAADAGLDRHRLRRAARLRAAGAAGGAGMVRGI